MEFHGNSSTNSCISFRFYRLFRRKLRSCILWWVWSQWAEHSIENARKWWSDRSHRCHLASARSLQWTACNTPSSFALYSPVVHSSSTWEYCNSYIHTTAHIATVPLRAGQQNNDNVTHLKETPSRTAPSLGHAGSGRAESDRAGSGRAGSGRGASRVWPSRVWPSRVWPSRVGSDRAEKRPVPISGTIETTIICDLIIILLFLCCAE